MDSVMMENENITDDEDILELPDLMQQPERRPRTFQQRENHFVKWDDGDFLKRFRLSKYGVRYLLNRIEIPNQAEKNHALTPEEMVLLTLRFYATGSFLQVVGDFIGIDKGTASRHIWRVTKIIAGLYRQYIKMPGTVEEMKSCSQGFYNKARFPKCVGALDCTHIKIMSPGGNDAEIYRNRKGFFSFNTQAVCDSNCLFQDVVCRWSGATHDSQIFGNSAIRAKFERGNFQQYLLVADSGYAVKKYLIPPLDNPMLPKENLFNKSQIRTRNPIERTFGIWKRRFPILATGIRLNKEKLEGIVIATAVLHNLCIILNETEPPITEEQEAAINFVNSVPTQNNRSNQITNESVRRQLINYLRTLN